MFSTHVSNIWKVLKDNGFTLSTYIEKVLESPDGALEECESLISNVQLICAALCSIDALGVFRIMVLMDSKRLSTEILGLSQVGGGLHFNDAHSICGCFSSSIDSSDTCPCQLTDILVSQYIQGSHDNDNAIIIE